MLHNSVSRANQVSEHIYRIYLQLNDVSNFSYDVTTALFGGKTKMNKNRLFIPDLHVHTIFSYDGMEQAENYVKKAVTDGNESIGFSEHYDFDCALIGNGTPLCNIGAYYTEILRLREKYSDKIKTLFIVFLPIFRR